VHPGEAKWDEEVRDFVQAHYHLNNRQDTEYWRAARDGMKLSDRLRENLKVWRHTTPEDLELDSAFLFSSPVYTLLLIAKGFYQDVRLAKASSLSRAAFERYRSAVRNARPDKLAGLISQAEFLRTGGEAPVDPLAGLRLAKAPAFGPAGTRIELPTQPAYPPVRRKPKR
jgi:Tryptophan halogenase